MAGVWGIVEVSVRELGEESIVVAYRWVWCGGEKCLLLAYTVNGVPRLVITPPPPSPLCVRAGRVDAAIARAVAEKLVAGVKAVGYTYPACLIPRLLLRDRLEDTVAHLESLGLFSTKPPVDT